MAELERRVTLDSIGTGEHVVTLEATTAECAAVATRLRIPAVTRLQCRLVLRRAGPATVDAEGALDADVVQTCVVTLEEVPQYVADRFRLRFVPAEQAEEDDSDPEAPDLIPYDGRALDLGEVAAEQLALALDPYPRTPGATLPDEDGAKMPHPFAGLGRWRS